MIQGIKMTFINIKLTQTTKIKIITMSSSPLTVKSTMHQTLESKVLLIRLTASSTKLIKLTKMLNLIILNNKIK